MNFGEEKGQIVGQEGQKVDHTGKGKHVAEQCLRPALLRIFQIRRPYPQNVIRQEKQRRSCFEHQENAAVSCLQLTEGAQHCHRQVDQNDHRAHHVVGAAQMFAAVPDLDHFIDVFPEFLPVLVHSSPG